MSAATLPQADELTAFQSHLLRTIQELGTPKGLAIKEELEAVYDTSINHGRLYPNLDTLVNRGLVEKGERDKRTNEYSLTEQGERQLRELQAWFAGA